MEKNMEDRFNDLQRVIGNTPLLELSFHYNKQPRTFYSKAEHYVATGTFCLPSNMTDCHSVLLYISRYSFDDLRQ